VPRPTLIERRILVDIQVFNRSSLPIFLTLAKKQNIILRFIRTKDDLIVGEAHQYNHARLWERHGSLSAVEDAGYIRFSQGGERCTLGGVSEVVLKKLGEPSFEVNRTQTLALLEDILGTSSLAIQLQHEPPPTDGVWQSS